MRHLVLNRSRALVLCAALGLALGACSAEASPGASQSTAPSSTYSPSAAPRDTRTPHQILADAISDSVDDLYEKGATEEFWDGKEVFYTAVYQPDSPYEYKGVGWTKSTDRVELVLELDMFEVSVIERAFNAAGPDDVTLLADDRLRLRSSVDYFPREALIELGNDGRIREIEYPTQSRPDRVRIIFSVAEFGEKIIKRANRELKD